MVFDRSKDVMILHDKSIFAPQYLETRLKFAPFIKDAWVIGDERPYVTAVVCIDYSVLVDGPTIRGSITPPTRNCPKNRKSMIWLKSRSGRRTAA